MSRILLLASVPGILAMASGSLIAAPIQYENDVVPLLSKYCYSCHGQQKQKAQLNLAKFPKLRDAMGDRRLWVNIQKMLVDKEMPPKKSKAQPASPRPRRSHST